jgi:phosphoenolpyruvate-protein kinase (PTS system EI component)
MVNAGRGKMFVTPHERGNDDFGGRAARIAPAAALSPQAEIRAIAAASDVTTLRILMPTIFDIYALLLLKGNWIVVLAANPTT